MYIYVYLCFMSIWNIFEDKFAHIINDNVEYNILLNRILLSQNNTLLYSSIGFPIDLFADLIIKKKFNIKNKIYRSEHVWDKTLIYNENSNFIPLKKCADIKLDQNSFRKKRKKKLKTNQIKKANRKF